MCVAIHKPAGVSIDEIIIRNCFNRNDHGAGFAYLAPEGGMVVKKAINDVDEFIKEVKAVEQNEMIIHCRVMSKGAISDANCHPFTIEGKDNPEMSYAVIHNGTLAWRSDQVRSDTSYFVEDFMSPLLERDPYFFEFSLNRGMFNAYIGSNNKMCVMSWDKANNEGKVFVLNRGQGIESNGIWFSNLSFSDDWSRNIFQGDHEKYKNWKPVLFYEKKTNNGGTQGSFGGGFHGNNGNHGGGGYSKNNTSNSPHYPGIQPNGTHLKFADGFGWYYTDPASVGKRSLKSYQEWKALQVKGGNGQPAPDCDQLTYLSQKQHKDIRKQSVEMLSTLYGKGFEFKGMTTPEIVAWARAELKHQFPVFGTRSNTQLASLILHGDWESVSEKE